MTSEAILAATLFDGATLHAGAITMACRGIAWPIANATKWIGKTKRGAG